MTSFICQMNGRVVLDYVQTKFYNVDTKMIGTCHVLHSPFILSDVIDWTYDVYFKRGQGYYASGAIYEQPRKGMKIKSKCSGSQAPFYFQAVIFDSRGIKSAECARTFGDGGHC